MPSWLICLVLAQGAPEAEPAAMVQRATALYEDLEYQQVSEIARAILEHPSASVDARMDAYLLLGKSLAVLDRPLEAEAAFRFLLRGRPEFELEEAPLKILRVFRNVKVEEERIRSETRELERAELIASLRLTGDAPTSVIGGDPVVFSYQLQDPRGAVRQLRVLYRKRGESNFTSMALERDAGGRWVGELPGAWTENESGFDLEYSVLANDSDDQPLLELPADSVPLSIDVLPGTVAGRTPFYRSTWFWVTVGSVAAALAVTGGVLYSQRPQLPSSRWEPVELP